MVWSPRRVVMPSARLASRGDRLAGMEQVQVAALDRGLRLELAGAAADRRQDRGPVLDHLERPAGPLELGDEVVADVDRPTREPRSARASSSSARPRRTRRSASRRSRPASARDGGPRRSGRPRRPATHRSGRPGRATAPGSPRPRASSPTIEPVRRKTTARPAASATNARIGSRTIQSQFTVLSPSSSVSRAARGAPRGAPDRPRTGRRRRTGRRSRRSARRGRD